MTNHELNDEIRRLRLMCEVEKERADENDDMIGKQADWQRRAREVLKEVEWKKDSEHQYRVDAEPACYICEGSKEYGHISNCKLAALLNESEGDK